MNRSGFDFNLMRALEVFSAVVETRNITQAAQILGITQSAASQHLHSLERAFDTVLLDRSTRPIELTRAGVLLQERSGRILGEVEELRSEMRRVESAPLPLLRVGLLASIATTLMPVITAFAQDRGIPELSCFAGLAPDHADLLRNRRADLVVTSDAQYESSGLDRHEILSESFLLVTPQGFGGRKDDLALLAEDLPLTRFAAHSPVGRRTDQHLRRLRLDLPRVIEADRASMVTAAVHAGRGFAILPPTLLLDALKEGMRLDLDPLPPPGFKRSITAVCRSRELGDLPRDLSLRITDGLRLAVEDLGDLCAQSVSFGETA